MEADIKQLIETAHVLEQNLHTHDVKVTALEAQIDNLQHKNLPDFGLSPENRSRGNSIDTSCYQRYWNIPIDVLKEKLN